MEKNLFTEIRESKNLSTAEFALAINAPQADVESWESGNTHPGKLKFLQILQFATGQK